MSFTGAGLYGGTPPRGPYAAPIPYGDQECIMRDLRERSGVVHTSASSCPVCGCDPANPWGCEDCDDPYCPCGETENDDD